MVTHAGPLQKHANVNQRNTRRYVDGFAHAVFVGNLNMWAFCRKEKNDSFRNVATDRQMEKHCNNAFGENVEKFQFQTISPVGFYFSVKVLLQLLKESNHPCLSYVSKVISELLE